MAETPRVYRTPDARFDELADFPFSPNWLERDGLRMHYVDEGAGRPVLMLHGEATWSYLYRSLISAVVAGEHRAIAPDLMGCGRSDKVTAPGWYSAERHIEWIDALILALDLEDVVLVVQGWGGPIGLRQAADMPERIASLVVMNSWLHHREYEYTAAVRAWHDRVVDDGDYSAGADVVDAIESSPRQDMGLDLNALRRADDAPFPTARSRAGMVAFASMLPYAEPDAGNAADQIRVFLSTRTFPGPVHLLWGSADDIYTDAWGREWADQIAGSTYESLPDVSRFVPEQAREDLIRAVLAQIDS